MRHSVGRTTSIGGRDVPIEEGDVPIVYFSAGRLGNSEAGLYQFWTAVSKGRGTTARSRAGSDPGERFRRMETSPADAQGWGLPLRLSLFDHRLRKTSSAGWTSSPATHRSPNGITPERAS